MSAEKIAFCLFAVRLPWAAEAMTWANLNSRVTKKRERRAWKSEEEAETRPPKRTAIASSRGKKVCAGGSEQECVARLRGSPRAPYCGNHVNTLLVSHRFPGRPCVWQFSSTSVGSIGVVLLFTKLMNAIFREEFGTHEILVVSSPRGTVAPTTRGEPPHRHHERLTTRQQR